MNEFRICLKAFCISANEDKVEILQVNSHDLDAIRWVLSALDNKG